MNSYQISHHTFVRRYCFIKTNTVTYLLESVTLGLISSQNKSIPPLHTTAMQARVVDATPFGVPKQELSEHLVRIIDIQIIFLGNNWSFGVVVKSNQLIYTN